MKSLSTVLFEKINAATCSQEPFESNEILESISVRQDFEGETICSSSKMKVNLTGISIGTSVWYIYEEVSKYLYVYGSGEI